jgi:hypothetical protein
VEFGVTKAASGNLLEATNTWLKAVAQSNPEMRVEGSQHAVQIAQRSGVATPLVNPSPLGGKERINVFTTFLSDGVLFYYLTVVPEKDAQAFDEAFRRVGESIRLASAR